MSKILLNSLYGKFGQLIDDYVEVEGDALGEFQTLSFWDCDQRRWRFIRQLDGKIEENMGKVEGYNSFAAISAHVTANARSLLLDIINAYGADRVLYCDTDSVFVLGAPDELTGIYPIGEALGQLKLEDHAQNVEIRGLKDYRFGHDDKIKGVKKGSTMNPDGSFAVTTFRGITGALKDGDTGRQLIYYRTKNLTREYTKGVVTDTGVVEPFVLAEDDSASSL